jgi:hypothetical protein
MNYINLNTHNINGKTQTGNFPVLIDSINTLGFISSTQSEANTNAIQLPNIESYFLAETGVYTCESYGYNALSSCGGGYNTQHIIIGELECFDCLKVNTCEDVGMLSSLLICSTDYMAVSSIFDTLTCYDCLPDCSFYEYYNSPNIDINYKSILRSLGYKNCYQYVYDPLPTAECTEDSVNILGDVGSFIINPYELLPIPTCTSEQGSLKVLNMCLRRYVYDYNAGVITLVGKYTISHAGALTPTTSFYNFSDPDLISFLTAGGFNLSGIYQLCIDVEWQRYYCVKRFTDSRIYTPIAPVEDSIGTVYSIYVGTV